MESRVLRSSSAVSAPSWCFFRSEAYPFAVELEVVAEVVQADRLIRLAHCPPQILGMCTVRRDVIPVLTLNPGAASTEPAPETPVVVLVIRSDQGMWGIRIDREGTAVGDGVLSDTYPGNGWRKRGQRRSWGSVRRGEIGPRGHRPQPDLVERPRLRSKPGINAR